MKDIHGDYSPDVGYQHQDLVQQAQNGIIKTSDVFVQQVLKVKLRIL